MKPLCLAFAFALALAPLGARADYRLDPGYADNGVLSRLTQVDVSLYVLVYETHQGETVYKETPYDFRDDTRRDLQHFFDFMVRGVLQEQGISFGIPDIKVEEALEAGGRMFEEEKEAFRTGYAYDHTEDSVVLQEFYRKTSPTMIADWAHQDLVKDHSRYIPQLMFRCVLERKGFRYHSTAQLELMEAVTIERLPQFQKKIVTWRRYRERDDNGYNRASGTFLNTFKGLLANFESHVRGANR